MPSDAQMLEAERRGLLSATEQESLNRLRDAGGFPRALGSSPGQESAPSGASLLGHAALNFGTGGVLGGDETPLAEQAGGLVADAPRMAGALGGGALGGRIPGPPIVRLIGAVLGAALGGGGADAAKAALTGAPVGPAATRGAVTSGVGELIPATTRRIGARSLAAEAAAQPPGRPELEAGASRIQQVVGRQAGELNQAANAEVASSSTLPSSVRPGEVPASVRVMRAPGEAPNQPGTANHTAAQFARSVVAKLPADQAQATVDVFTRNQDVYHAIMARATPAEATELGGLLKRFTTTAQPAAGLHVFFGVLRAGVPGAGGLLAGGPAGGAAGALLGYASGPAARTVGRAQARSPLFDAAFRAGMQAASGQTIGQTEGWN